MTSFTEGSQSQKLRLHGPDLAQANHMKTVWNDDGVFLKRKGGDVQDVSTGPLFGADLKGAFSSEVGPLGVSSKKM